VSISKSPAIFGGGSIRLVAFQLLTQSERDDRKLLPLSADKRKIEGTELNPQKNPDFILEGQNSAQAQGRQSKI